MLKLFAKFTQQKKIITCTSCQKRFQFPVKPGKTLNVTCPKCQSTYRVSFVNPLIELITGRSKWRSLSPSEKTKIIWVGVIIMVCLGLILSSLARPVKPSHNSTDVLVDAR
jgi:PHP family Zn ribbon phosphoesterase